MKCASITKQGTACTNNVLSGLGTVEHQGMIFRLCRIHAEAWARGTWTPNWDRAERKPRLPQSEQPMLPVEFGPVTQAYLNRTNRKPNNKEQNTMNFMYDGWMALIRQLIYAVNETVHEIKQCGPWCEHMSADVYAGEWYDWLMTQDEVTFVPHRYNDWTPTTKEEFTPECEHCDMMYAVPGPMSDNWVEPEDDGPEIHESISLGQQRAGAHLYRTLLKKGRINAANNVTIGRGKNSIKVSEVIHKIK